MLHAFTSPVGSSDTIEFPVFRCGKTDRWRQPTIRVHTGSGSTLALLDQSALGPGKSPLVDPGGGQERRHSGSGQFGVVE